ncbi:MAG TPA: hypothetical protein VFZ48_04115 [Candidatus Saccharimonadales bacterium]
MALTVVEFDLQDPGKLVVRCDQALLRHNAQSHYFVLNSPEDDSTSYSEVGKAIRSCLVETGLVAHVSIGDFGFEVLRPQPISMSYVWKILETFRKFSPDKLEVSLLRPGDISRNAERTPMSNEAFRAKLTMFMSHG